MTSVATILVVEDRPADRQLLATLLGYCGHRVLQADDGAAALVSAAAYHPELIISDVLMPSMDGYEFVRRLREIDGIAETPVIFYTATYHEREARDLAERCGVVDILTKPSEPDAILAAIDAVLKRGRQRLAPVEDAPRSFDRDHWHVVNAKLARKLTDLESAEQRLAAVVEFCRLFATERDRSVLLRQVAAISRRVTFAKHSFVGLLSEDGATVEHFLVDGLDPETVSRLEAPSPRARVLHRVLSERAAFRGRNPGGRPEALGLPPNHPEIHSYLAVPIESPSRVYGWLSVRNKLGAEEFTAEDEEIATILGAHAGVAYENARLIDDLNHQAAALRDEQERTTYALGAAHMGVWQIELASDRLTWSDTMPAVFDLTPDRIPSTGREFFDLVHADDRPAVEQAVATAIGEGREMNVEFRIASPGSARWIAGRAQVFGDAGLTPARLIGVAIDISNRRSLEDQLRQAQKLEAIGQLAGGVAHDFNNLLTAILGYSNFVAETLDPGDARRSDLEEVISAGQRASTLTKQLLAFSRKQIMQPVLVDVNQVVVGMRQMLGRLIGEHIELDTVLDQGVRRVRADPGQLEQVLMNLVVNARDAMPRGGRLSN
jgi:DNA-binding response OmpR family regulator/signal transduction histidine kinase